MSLAVIDRTWRRCLPADGSSTTSASLLGERERNRVWQHAAAAHTQGHLPLNVPWKGKLKGQARKWKVCSFFFESGSEDALARFPLHPAATDE